MTVATSPVDTAMEARVADHGGEIAIDMAPDTDAVAWDAYVNAHPSAVCYHQHAWRAVFERAFGHRTVYLAARRDGRVVGVLPLVEMRSLIFGRFLVSLPFVNYGGVLADDAAVEHALFERAAAIARERRLSHVELRHFQQHFADAPCRRHKVTMLLRLDAEAEAMWARLDRKVRNQVRKAEKGGLTFEAGGSELIDAFYPVFATNMRDLGTPVYSRRLFDEVFAALPGRAAVFVVRTGEGTPIAAGVGLRFRETLEMPWASSLRAYRATSANMLLYWGAIRYAIESGAGVFDFGRSTPHESTYKFKEQWGAEAVPLVWEYRLLKGSAVPNQSPGSGAFALASAAWKRMPGWAARLMGPSIVRSIP